MATNRPPPLHGDYKNTDSSAEPPSSNMDCSRVSDVDIKALTREGFLNQGSTFGGLRN